MIFHSWLQNEVLLGLEFKAQMHHRWCYQEGDSKQDAVETATLYSRWVSSPC